MTGQRYQEARDTLTAALDLWRGPTLANVTEFLAQAEGQRLEEARVAAAEQRVEADLALGMHRQILPELTGLVAKFPLRERLRANLMTALYRCDRQADALTVFHGGRKVLADELGVDPGTALHDTYQAVLENDLQLPTPRGTVRITEAAGSAPTTMMLPPAIPHFTGRDAELATLTEVISAPSGPAIRWRPLRAVITGVPGVGKTALIRQAAYANAKYFPDGVLYADCARPDGTPNDPAEVLGRLLLGVGEQPHTENLHERELQFRHWCTGKRVLLVLDNVSSELQLDPLLPNNSDAAAIIASPEHLGALASDHTTVLTPMSEQDSREVIAAIAGEHRLAEAPTAVRELISHCAGLPLALRIVGAKLAARPLLSAERLVQRLNCADAAGRLDELTCGQLDIRNSLSRPLRRSSDAATELFSDLARFGEAEFDVDDAAKVVDQDDAERLLEELVDVRLLDVAGIDAGGRLRYRFEPLAHLLAADIAAQFANTSRSDITA